MHLVRILNHPAGPIQRRVLRVTPTAIIIALDETTNGGISFSRKGESWHSSAVWRDTRIHPEDLAMILAAPLEPEKPAILRKHPSVVYEGVEKSISAWCIHYKIDYKTMVRRVSSGEDGATVLADMIEKKRKKELFEKRKSENTSATALPDRSGVQWSCLKGHWTGPRKKAYSDGVLIGCPVCKGRLKRAESELRV